MKTANKTHSDIFSMYSQYFELMEFHSYLFEKTIDCTEADVVIKMWSPLIEKLFRREGLRTKWGESMGELVDEQQSSTNMRLVAKRRKEADKADIQVARFGSGAIKITSDKTKLFIESKMVIDHIAKEETAKAANIIVPSLQIIGSKVALFSTKLEGNGVYVAVKEGSATIPSHMLHVKDFREVIMLLYKFKAATLNLMARIQT
ncbi:hypothetical protein EDC96DRAFT_114937 [Choanephora cucurbitarum]|nr:hypothetical protein EDC96DRAFT_114937 [Choanephora cucurbitarum]